MRVTTETRIYPAAWVRLLLLGWAASLTAPAALARQDDPPPALPEPTVLTGHVGDLIQIGANGSVQSAGEHWELVSHPDGSQAVLRSNPWLPGLRLQPDVNGVYVVDDEDASGAVREETILNIGSAGTITPVRTRVVSNNGSQSEDYAIVVNDRSYPAQKGLGSNGLQVLLLQRQTLEVKEQRTVVTMSEAKTYLQSLLNRKDLNALYIISSLRRVGGAVSTIAPELERLGTTKEFAGITDPGFTFTLIGSPGWRTGQAYQVGDPAADGLVGSFVRDSENYYTFLQTDYTRFTLRPSTTGPASVQIGNTPAIQSTPKSGAYGGFLLAVFDRASLQVKTSDSYYTYAVFDSTSEIQRLVQDLQKYQGQENALLALVSFGQPYIGFDSLFSTVGRAVSSLGGTYEAVYDLNRQDTYALLISSSPPAELGLPRFPMAEAGTKVSPSAAKGPLTGMLARGRRGNWYAPVASAATADTNLELYAILAQPPVPFPHPAPGQAGEQKAYHDISDILCKYVSLANCSDLRANYGNQNFEPATRLNLLTTSANHDPDNPAIDCNRTTAKTDYCTVYDQLKTELVYTGDIRNFNTNLRTLSISYQSTVATTLTDVQGFFKQQIRLDQARRAEPVIPAAVSTFFSIASYVPGAVGTAAGVVNGALLFTSAVTNRSDGSSLVFDVETTVGTLAQQANDAFVQQLKANGVMFRCIYEDWGKLQTLGQALQSGQAGWFWDDTTTGSLLKQLNTAYEISIYRSLMSSLFVRRLWNSQSSKDQEPGEYKYLQVTPLLPFVPFYYSIFRNWKDNPGGFLASPSPRTDQNGAQRDFLMLTQPGQAVEETLPKRFTYEQVPRPLLEQIFGEKGLGVLKPEVYRQWPFQTFYCGAPGFGIYSGSNCDFTTPKLPQ